jgi:PAS domain S-box-containing protein
MPPKIRNLISFGTGSVSHEEMEAFLDSLPLDITFVDSADTVRYFNKLGKRIFPRTPAVIGRKVQQCHPQKSLAKVEEILRDFRSGKRDSSEFWISLKGRMVHIRYFAVRDPKGRYLGCLEASQDITDIQKIKGEKRLL